MVSKIEEKKKSCQQIIVLLKLILSFAFVFAAILISDSIFHSRAKLPKVTLTVKLNKV